MAIIFYLSGRTSSSLNQTFPFIRDFNFGHIVAYFILSGLIYFALSRSTRAKPIHLWSIGITMFYAFTDEFHQSFVPTRNPELGDILRDMVGASLAQLLIWGCKARKKPPASTEERVNNS